MKSNQVGAGQPILATQIDNIRSDAAGAGALLAHQQLGALALGTLPSNGQVIPIIINGTTITITAVSSIGSTPNNILIPGSAAAFALNVWNFLIRPDITNANQVAATSANQALIQLLGYALPTGGTTITIYSLNNSQNQLFSTLTFGSITVTSGSWTAQTMKLYVEPGIFYINGTKVNFLGGSSPLVTAPSSYPRIDILTINSSGTLAWTTGTENVSPTVPAYPSYTLIVLCELYNVVGETILEDYVNQQAGQGYIQLDSRSFPSVITNFDAISQDFIPDTTNTRSLGTVSVQFLNIYAQNIFSGSQAVAFAKFGGTGANGALNVTSGTTTLSLGSASVAIFNYTSINVSPGATLAFSSPGANGTMIILKSQGAVTISATITTVGMGAPAATAGLESMYTTVPTGGATASSQTGAAAGTGLAFPWLGAVIGKTYNVATGSGGGNGKAAVGGSGGVGGAGGGGLIIECGGALNFTGTINCNGAAGATATGGTNNNGGGGGGGGGGTCYVFYNSLIANTGTVTVAGGAGGNGGVGGGRNATAGGGGGGGGANTANGGAGGSGSSANSSANGSNGSGGTGGSGGAGGTGGGNGGFFGSGTAGDGGGGGGGGGGTGFSFVAQNIDWS